MKDVTAQGDYPYVSFLDQDGVRTLHFGTKWTQGAMRLAQPESLELEYIQQMMMWWLFNETPKHIVQLGLGAGSLSKFTYRHFPDARVTAIELDPNVIRVCETMFDLPPNDERLNVRHMDALDFVMDASNRNTVDILQVDLYDAQALGPVFESPEFYQACADCLTADGMMTVNLFCDPPDHEKNLQAMEQAFVALAWLPEVHDGNIVAIGFRNASSIDFDDLYQRADLINDLSGLPARSWVDGLQSWMQGL